ncbi:MULTISPECIES: tautomerase PptA [Tenebrionibacter/Tenebrionicola group]|uniref:Tautomerase PptA n=2 Tax=Tenebrionibacter/Tenebrionicola group TaxID=2969848 RepID=A0A8K0V552_9ENTR|nr:MULTISPECIES: tautomerase PptA [Tenebrionibacter/Tenebrionicola group]MBK4716981.1 tautomerase PptA [Tenebrionibacter intestinalis]MBV4411249.1 tautomerase PptA [Tenebrionicola larvae]MBV5097519.1 tautomerase PptA [Tenebrionicola larvae]
MPHIDIKYFPRDLSEAQKQSLVDDLCDVIKKHLHSADSALSVALNEVAPERWQTDVYDPLIRPSLETLAKKPGYTL